MVEALLSGSVAAWYILGLCLLLFIIITIKR